MKKTYCTTEFLVINDTNNAMTEATTDHNKLCQSHFLLRNFSIANQSEVSIQHNHNLEIHE